MSVIKLKPEADIFYNLEHGKVAGVSLGDIEEFRIYLETPEKGRPTCQASINGEWVTMETQGLKDLFIAWLAIVSPEVLKYDD